MPRVYKAVIKAKGGYFEESKIYFDLFNTFPSFDVETSKEKKRKTLERVGVSKL